MKHQFSILGIGLALVISGCTSSAQVESLRSDLTRVDTRFEAAEPSAEPSTVRLNGTVDSYVDYAMTQSPSLQVRYAQWRAAIAKVGASDQLPEPTLTYSVFIQRVETRVGPQRQRLGVRFALPWPSKLTASAEASTRMARAAGHRFEAEVIALERRIHDAYWPLWAIHQRRAVLLDQLALMEQLTTSTRARLELGKATVADVSQLELSLSRLTDMILTLDASQREAEASLIDIAGLPQSSTIPIAEDAFQQARPLETPNELKAQVHAHPRSLVSAQLAEAKRAEVRRAEANYYPDMTFGLDYIDTAEIKGVSIPDNGKDPIAAVIGLKLPIWFEAYSAEASSTSSQALAFEHQRDADENELQAQVVSALARIKDTNRRLTLFDTTLIPQAETAFGSSIGVYEADGRSVASILLAYRDLNTLRLDKIDIQTRHALAWIWLESSVGRAVRSEVLP